MSVKIIATKTDERWGYRKGDVLEITERRGNVVFAKNLTAPDNYGRLNALIHLNEYNYAADVPKLTTEYRIFGMPVWRKYEYERD